MTCVIDTGVSPLGCILWLLFTIVSFGLAIVVWLWYWFVERDGFLPQVVVTAFPESSGMSKVTVISQKREKPQEMPEFTEPVTQWIQRELVEKRRAATEVPEVAPTTSGDIPDQIKRLAELRDSGAITDEEFERKKAELLDRM